MKAIDIIKTAVMALDDKKAKDIEVIKIGELTIIADYFIVASGTSSTQVKALAEEIDYKLSEKGIEPHHIEGRATGWILLDYGPVVIHVFHEESREFYSLERHWTDGQRIDISEFLKGG